jgi:hypothetical protein
MIIKMQTEDPLWGSFNLNTWDTTLQEPIYIYFFNFKVVRLNPILGQIFLSNQAECDREPKMSYK